MIQKKPRVSIGLPVFNGERFLEETLDSILAQTFSDFELIISDNASTDKTREICERYTAQDERVKYFRSAQNLGVAPNYNRAFTLSSGEYFKWADYDDPLAPDFILRCVEVLDNHPEVAVCFPKAKFIDENGTFLNDYDPLPDTTSPEPHVRFGKLLLEHDHRLAQASGMMRSDLVRKTILHGSYPCSDEVLMAHMSLLGSYYEIPERLFYLRYHPYMSSKGVLASERSRVLFFDSSLKDQAVLIKWLYFKDCFRAINHSPIGIYQRMRCYPYVIRWATKPQNFKSLMKDILLGIHKRIPLFPRLYQETIDAANKPHHYN